MAAGIQPVLESISFALKALENEYLILFQQKMENLVRSIVSMVHMKTTEEDDSFELMSVGSYNFSGDDSKWWIALEDVETRVADCGSRTQFEFQIISAEEVKEVLTVVAKYCISLGWEYRR